MYGCYIYSKPEWLEYGSLCIIQKIKKYLDLVTLCDSSKYVVVRRLFFSSICPERDICNEVYKSEYLREDTHKKSGFFSGRTTKDLTPP